MYYLLSVKLRSSTLLTLPYQAIWRHGCHAISMQVPLSAISVRCWSRCCYCYGFVLQVDKLVEHSTTQAIRQWRRLPPVISQQHIPLLQVGWTKYFVSSCSISCCFPDVVAYCFRCYFQAAQQIMELQEAAQIHTGLQPPNVGRSTSLHDMKAIVKTWRWGLPSSYLLRNIVFELSTTTVVIGVSFSHLVIAFPCHLIIYHTGMTCLCGDIIIIRQLWRHMRVKPNMNRSVNTRLSSC